MKNEELQFLVENLVTRPGVYLMKDKHGKIIYIGKAKNLRNRVTQYFTRPQSGKVRAMVNNIASFETYITDTEKDALILELKLIQTHYPRYNILLKDDSHYPYISLTKTGDPVVKIERKANNPNHYYFGPFPASSSAYQIVDLVNKLFKTKKCKSKGKEPCFYYHLDQCLGYCFKDVTDEDKEIVRRQVHNFLTGKDKTTIRTYETRMKEASAVQNYERALEYKQTLTAINHVLSSQNVELKNKMDVDVIAFTTMQDLIGLVIISYRNGVYLSKQFEVINSFDDLTEQLITLLLQYYENRLVPKHIIIGSDVLAEKLGLVYDSKIIVPQTGQYIELLNNAYKNAGDELSKHLLFHQQLDAENEVLSEFATKLNIAYPRHIDMVDIAHLSGSDAIGVMVTFINGRAFKKLYRKYNITNVNKFDDYANINEVLTRHYERKLAEGANIPDLLFVDGGKGQLCIAREVKERLKLKFPMFGLVKSDKHHTRALLNENNEEIMIDKQQLQLLASMQEEVHRYAITSHRAKRVKSTYVSVFDQVKGLGKKRQMLLINTYQTLDAIKKTSLEELKQIIPESVAVALLEVLANI